MPLLPPRVVGPLSECSSGVRVQNQLTGSTVELLVDGNPSPVGGGTASWSDEVFALSPGVTLAPGAKVRARQRLGADVSAASPDAVDVQKRPPTIGSVVYQSHLYVCGECLWLTGLVPGASVEIRVGGALRGSGSSYDGNARLHLTAPIGSGDVLQARQTACGIPGAITSSPAADPVPRVEGLRGGLFPPTVGTPLKECSRAVLVAGVLEGATVDLNRSVGASAAACFDASALWFRVSSPLGLNEAVSARQRFPACNLFSLFSAPPEVAQTAEPVLPPKVMAPLCAGAQVIRVTDIIPFARIHVFQDGVELGVAEAPDQASADLYVPALTGGTSITATLEMCGHTSVPSKPVPVDAAPGTLPTPNIPGPLVECGSVVHVKNLHPGAKVFVHSALLNAVIRDELVFATEADIPVAPLLIAGDSITATQHGCGQVSATSAPRNVDPLGRLTPPRVDRPVTECMRAIPIRDAKPGAMVDVYVNNAWRGSAPAGQPTCRVPLKSGKLNFGDRVKARQRLCDQFTGFSPEEIVVRSPGRWYIADTITPGGDPTDSEILAVHAALLRTHEILYFSGDQHDAALNDQGRTDPSKVDATRLFNCNTFVVERVGSPTHDMFCCGHAMLADGRLVAAGGTDDFPDKAVHDPFGHGPSEHFRGHRRCWIFDPMTQAWSVAADLIPEPGREPFGGGRWYPTLITLIDGRVLAMSGHPLHTDSRHNNTSLEVFAAPTAANPAGTWTRIGPANYPQIIHYYPRLHVVRGGRVFDSTEMGNGMVQRLDPGTAAWTTVGAKFPGAVYLSCASVLLPLRFEDDYQSLVLLAGDVTPRVINALSGGGAVWTATGPRAFGGTPPVRIHCNGVLLPTSEVFICGGAQDRNDDTTGVLEGELYKPVPNTWELLPKAEVVRNYHSTAMLMPDGRVWTAGSNFGSRGSDVAGEDNRELRIEIFEPWYFCANRPVITFAPAEIYYDREFEITTPDASSITSVALIHPGTVTHSTNAGQCHIGLRFSRGAGRLFVTAPPNAVAVPGYYLLYILRRDSDGREVPSVGRFVRIGARPRRWWWEWFEDRWPWFTLGAAFAGAGYLAGITRKASLRQSDSQRGLPP